MLFLLVRDIPGTGAKCRMFVVNRLLYLFLARVPGRRTLLL